MTGGDVNPTPYPALNDVLDRLVAGVRPALADNLVGVYLQGSCVSRSVWRRYEPPPKQLFYLDDGARAR